MNDPISNKQILQNLVERKIGNILDSTDELIDMFLNGNPAISNLAKTTLNAKKKQWIPQLQQYSDLLVETSCIDPEATLEQAIINAETTLNEYVSNFLAEKLGIPIGTIQIGLQVLLGDQLFKL